MCLCVGVGVGVLQSPRTSYDRIYVLPLLTILTNKARRAPRLPPGHLLCHARNRPAVAWASPLCCCQPLPCLPWH